MEQSLGRAFIRQAWSVMLTVGFVSIPLSWATYQSSAAVLNFLVFILVGVAAYLIWSLPIFIGTSLMILSLSGILPVHAYQLSLDLAGLNSSWMTLAWFCVAAVPGVLTNLILTLELVSRLRYRQFKVTPPTRNLALVNCRIIDGNLDSGIVSDGVILIRSRVERDESSGIISAVGTRAAVPIPAGFEQIDLEGKYVLPGLINAHCHMFGDGSPSRLSTMRDETVNWIIGLFRYSFIQRLYYRKMVKNINTALNAGVTTLRVMGELKYLDLKIRDEINTGKIKGPRLLCSGQLISPSGGHGRESIALKGDGPTEIRKAVRITVREQVDVVKISSTGGVGDSRVIGEAGRPQMTVEEIETACTEAHRAGLMVSSHCESTEGIREALAGGVDTIEHGADIPEELVEQFKNNPRTLRGYTCLVPTLSAAMGLATLPPQETGMTPVKYENARIVAQGMIQGLQKAYHSGIKFATGTDATVPYATQYEVWKELKYYLKYTSMTAREAIHFANKNTAEVLGIDGITGSIEVGKSADLQVVAENPFENIDALGKVDKVVIRGHLIDQPTFNKLRNARTITPLEIDLSR